MPQTDIATFIFVVVRFPDIGLVENPEVPHEIPHSEVPELLK